LYYFSDETNSPGNKLSNIKFIDIHKVYNESMSGKDLRMKKLITQLLQINNTQNKSLKS